MMAIRSTRKGTNPKDQTITCLPQPKQPRFPTREIIDKLSILKLRSTLATSDHPYCWCRLFACRILRKFWRSFPHIAQIMHIYGQLGCHSYASTLWNDICRIEFCINLEVAKAFMMFTIWGSIFTKMDLWNKTDGGWWARHRRYWELWQFRHDWVM